MRLNLTDYQVDLIRYCLLKQESELNQREQENVDKILQQFEIAESFEYDF